LKAASTSATPATTSSAGAAQESLPEEVTPRWRPREKVIRVKPKKAKFSTCNHPKDPRARPLGHGTSEAPRGSHPNRSMKPYCARVKKITTTANTAAPIMPAREALLSDTTLSPLRFPLK
jgi:hypothetical protein